MPSSRELLQLTERVVALHEAKSFEQIVNTAQEAISALIPCDWPMVSALVSGPPTIRVEFPDGELRPTFEEFDRRAHGLQHEDPTFTNRLRLTMDGAHQPREFVDRTAFERTRLFNDVWRPMGIRQMLRFSNPGILGTGVVIARNSDRPFSGDEIDMAEVIGRQLDSSIHKLLDRHNGKVPIHGEMVSMHTSSWLVCAADGTILRSTPASREQYRLCLGEKASLKKVPDAWRVVFESRLRGGPADPKHYRAAGRSITVHIAPIPGHTHEFSVFFINNVLQEDPYEKLMQLGLTNREAEVMYWVIEGKTNPEIAAIMGISALTAKKHVENIRIKFQVPNRTAAVVYAMERMR